MPKEIAPRKSAWMHDMRHGSVETRRASIAALRWIVGISFIASGVLKAAGLHLPAFRKTLVWELLAGDETLILALAAVEGFLGGALAADAWPRTVGWMLIAMVSSFTVLLLVVGSDGTAIKPCGCFGPARYETEFPLRGLLRNLMILTRLFVITLAGRSSMRRAVPDA